MQRTANGAPSQPIVARTSLGHSRAASAALGPLQDSKYPPQVGENLPIIQNLLRFEQTLGQLIDSVQRYDPKPELAEELLVIDTALAGDVKRLQHHQAQGREIRQLTLRLAEADGRAKNLLRELVACRNTLRALPTHDENAAERPDVGAEELLEYARKLSKFSTAPATFAPGTVGPADYVWPAENMLRRGMLAIASLKVDELLRDDDEAVVGGGTSPLVEMASGVASPEPVRRGSFGTPQGYAGEMEGAAIDDLDLFDPDAE